MPTFNSETSKYLDPSFEAALNAKQARIKALNEEILLAMQKEQNEYITRYKEVEDAKKKLAEYEGKLKEEGISDEDKTKLKTDITSLKEFINGGVNSLDSSIGSVASKIQERTSAINECNEIVKSGNEQAKQISELVDKAQGVNFDSKIAEVNKIEVKKQGNGVDVSGDRSNYYSPEDENSVNAKNKSISDAQIQVDNVKKALEDNNAKIKNDQTSLSKIVGDIANMSAADKTKALENIKGLAGGILTSGDKVGVDINNLKNAKNNVNLSVEQYNLAVQAANTNISAIKKAVEDARNVQFEEKVDYYADDIKLAAEKSVNTKNGRDKYYSEDDKNKVGAKQKELDDAKAATKKAQKAYDENNGKLKNSQQSLEDLIASLATASGDAKTAALNKIKQVTGTIMASGETIQNNIEAYKTAKGAQSTAINSYNNAVDTANANIDAAVAAAAAKQSKDTSVVETTTNAGGSNGTNNNGSSGSGGSGVSGNAGNAGNAGNGSSGVPVNSNRKAVNTEKIENPDGTITTKTTYDDKSIKEETKNKDDILTQTKETAPDGNYSVIAYDKDGKNEKNLTNYNKDDVMTSKIEYTYKGDKKLPEIETKYNELGNSTEIKTHTYNDEGRKLSELTIAYTTGADKKEIKTTTSISYDDKNRIADELVITEAKNTKGEYEKTSSVSTTYTKDTDDRLSPSTTTITYKDGKEDTIDKDGIVTFGSESKQLTKLINTLYNSTANMLGTDEDAVKKIILGEGEGATQYSDAQLVQIMQAYEKKHGASLIQHIQNDFSGGDENVLREKLFGAMQNEVMRIKKYDAPASKKVADGVEEFNRELNSGIAIGFMGKFTSDEYTDAEKVEILAKYADEYGANPIKDITDYAWFGAEDGHVRNIFEAYLNVLKN